MKLSNNTLVPMRDLRMVVILPVERLRDISETRLQPSNN